MRRWKPAFQKYGLLSAFILVSGFCHCQNGFSAAPGGRSIGLGMITTTLDDLSCIFTNASANAFSEMGGISTYATQQFGLAKLREAGIAGSFTRHGWGTFFGSFRSTGFEAYRETRFSIGYGRKVHSNFALSASFNLHQVRIPEYGSASAPSVDIGFYYQASGSLAIGGHVVNPVKFTRDLSLQLPSLLRTGVAYAPGNTVSVFAEIEKDAQYPVSFKAAIEYTPMPQVSFRMGARTEPATAHLGIGYSFLENWSVDLGVSYDIRLGMTPGISLSYRPQKKES